MEILQVGEGLDHEFVEQRLGRDAGGNQYNSR